MTDPALTASLEERLVNAWPSFEVQTCEGWLLRFAGGYSKRANSATPLVPGARLEDALVDHIAAQFLRETIRPTFRLTGLEAPGTEELLAARGFAAIEPSLAMVRAIPDEAEPDPHVLLEPTVTSAWVRETAASYGGPKANDARLNDIVSRIRQPAAFAALDLDGEHVAWGLGVAERGFVGLYDIVVAPDLRGIGLGRRVVMSLMAWGRAQGATRAYLQVREDNAVACSLYEGLGFDLAYRYTHRVMP
jgi:N-acetylglutamate synthase